MGMKVWLVTEEFDDDEDITHQSVCGIYSTFEGLAVAFPREWCSMSEGVWEQPTSLREGHRYAEEWNVQEIRTA